MIFELPLQPLQTSERAEGAEKASCRETAVHKDVFGESVFFIAPLRFALKTLEDLRINQGHVAVHFSNLDDCFSARLGKIEWGVFGRVGSCNNDLSSNPTLQ